jgi:hypothetical protein
MSDLVRDGPALGRRRQPPLRSRQIVDKPVEVIAFGAQIAQHRVQIRHTASLTPSPEKIKHARLFPALAGGTVARGGVRRAAGCGGPSISTYDGKSALDGNKAVVKRQVSLQQAANFRHNWGAIWDISHLILM